jgi:hypothetical protein
MIVPCNGIGKVFSAFQKNEAPDHATIAQAEDELMQAEENPQEAHKLMQQINQSLQKLETADKAAWHLASRIKRAEAPRPKQPEYIPGLCGERTFISALKTISRQASQEMAEANLFRKNIQYLCAQIKTIKADHAKLSPISRLSAELIIPICALANLKHIGVSKGIDPAIVEGMIKLLNTQRLDLVQDIGFTSLEQIMDFFGDQFCRIKHLSIMGLKTICNDIAAPIQQLETCFIKFRDSLKDLKSFAFFSDPELCIVLQGDLVEFASRNPNLEQLALVCDGLQESGTIKGMEHFTKIKSLELVGFELDGRVIYNICSLENLKTIEKLTIDIKKINESDLMVLSKLPNLKKLNLSNTPKITSTVLRVVIMQNLKACPLEELNLFNFVMSNELCDALATTFSNLKSLKLYNCFTVGFESKKALMIEELGCYHCSFFSNKLGLFCDSYNHLNKLKKIEFIGCTEGRDSAHAVEFVTKHHHNPNISLFCEAAPWVHEAINNYIPLKMKFYERKCAHLKPINQAKS